MADERPSLANGPRVSVRRFGAKGDGIALDRQAIEAGIAQVDSGTIIEFPAGSYRIDSQILVGRSNLKFEFQPGARLVTDLSKNNGLTVAGGAPEAWLPLATDAPRGSRSIELADASSISTGAWIELRSDAVLPDVPNKNRKRVSELHRIIGRLGSTVHIAGTLLYDYRVMDLARVGIAMIVENITIEGYRHDVAAGQIGSTMLRGLYLGYAAHVIVRDFAIANSRELEGPDVRASCGIMLTNAQDVLLEEGRLENLGYYGVGLDNACRFVTMRGLHGSRCRHMVSLSWSGRFGEPVDILHEHCVSDYSTLSGFDTHDVGRAITYLNCTTRESGDDGFQNRNGMTEYIACKAIGSRLDGFSVSDGARGVRHVECQSIGNGRHGLNNANADAYVSGGRYASNGAAYADGGGIVCLGGSITGVELRDNPCAIQYGDGTERPLDGLSIRGVTAPASVRQQDLLRLNGQGSFDRVTVQDASIPGYDNRYWIFIGSVQRTDWPLTNGNTTTDLTVGAEMHGTATLHAGTAAIKTHAVRNFAGAVGAATLCPYYSKISLVRLSGSDAALHVTSLEDQVGFVIKSTDAGDGGRVYWEIEN